MYGDNVIDFQEAVLKADPFGFSAYMRIMTDLYGINIEFYNKMLEMSFTMLTGVSLESKLVDNVVLFTKRK